MKGHLLEEAMSGRVGPARSMGASSRGSSRSRDPWRLGQRLERRHQRSRMWLDAWSQVREGGDRQRTCGLVKGFRLWPCVMCVNCSSLLSRARWWSPLHLILSQFAEEQDLGKETREECYSRCWRTVGSCWWLMQVCWAALLRDLEAKHERLVFLAFAFFSFLIPSAFCFSPISLSVLSCLLLPAEARHVDSSSSFLARMVELTLLVNFFKNQCYWGRIYIQ